MRLTSLRRWLDRPENELLQKELLWTGRWLLSPWNLGLLALFAFTALVLASPLMSRLYSVLFPAGLASNPFALAIHSLIASSSFPASLVLWSIIGWIYMRRGLPLLTQPRLSELLVTRIGPGSLWATVLAAPLATHICYLGSLWLGIGLWQNWMTPPRIVGDLSATNATLGLVVWILSFFYVALEGVLYSLRTAALMLGAMAFSLWATLPHPRLPRCAGVMLVLWSAVILGCHFLVTEALSRLWGPNAPFDFRKEVIWTITNGTAEFVIFGLFGLWGFRTLVSAKTWNKVRVAAGEAGSS